jgi:nucleotide-binding universal stress UspA family protein
VSASRTVADRPAAPGVSGPVVVGDDGRAGGADAMAFASMLATELGCEPIVACVGAGTPVAHGLGERAVRERAGLVVVGAHDRHGHGFLHGGIAERVLHDARCPVAVVPAGWAADPQPLRVVGVAYDGGSEARAALALGRGLAERARAAMRVIAVEPAVPKVHASALGPAPAARPATDVMADELHDAVNELPRALRALPVLEHGDPVKRLAEESAKGLDVLVCGSRGHGPLGGVLLGSVSRALVRSAACPVLVVPRGAPAIAST